MLCPLLWVENVPCKSLLSAALLRRRYTVRCSRADIVVRGVGFSGRGIHIVLLLQKSATSPGWTPGTSSHYLPNSHIWLREVACAQQRPYPGTPCWLTHHITACCLHKLMNTAYIVTTVPSQLSALMRCTALKLGVIVANSKVHNFNHGTLCCRWNWKYSLSRPIVQGS